MALRRWMGALALLLLLSGSAAAESKAKAREQFRLGTQHYKLGEYADALTAFKEAFRNYEDPSFLFNIAQCHRQLGQKQDAIRFFRTYLNDVPDAPNRAEVQKMMQALEVALARESESKNTPPVDTMPPSESVKHAEEPARPAGLVAVAERPVETRPPIYKRWWLWTAVGVAVVGVGLGVGLGLGLKAGPSAPEVASDLGTFRPGF